MNNVDIFQMLDAPEMALLIWPTVKKFQIIHPPDTACACRHTPPSTPPVFPSGSWNMYYHWYTQLNNNAYIQILHCHVEC